jgi:hypothetical protein
VSDARAADANVADGGTVDASSASKADASAVDARIEAGAADASTDAQGSLKTIPITSSGSCNAGEVNGAVSAAACFTPTQLAAWGCSVGETAAKGQWMVVASEAQMTTAKFAIQYTTADGLTIYLCTGSQMPSTDWACGNVLLSNCATPNDCRDLYILSPMPVFNRACSG